MLLSRAVHFLPTDPGTRWVKDPGVVIDVPDLPGPWKMLTPNVVAVPGGGFRMYLSRSGPGLDYDHVPTVILSARSADGERWELDPGVRLAPYGPHADVRVVCPDVVPLAEGGYRMYFEGQPAAGPAVILSARSSDGLAWEPEPGVRFGDPARRLGSPRAVYVGDDGSGRARVRLYFHSYTQPLRGGLDAGNHILSAISDDGLVFTPEPGVRIAQEGPLQTFAVYAAEALLLGDGTYRMYYAGWTEEPLRGRIFSATSRDGLDWVRDAEPNVEFGGRHDATKCSEPCVMRLPDGRYRMFYEACDAVGEWRILSCSAAPA